MAEQGKLDDQVTDLVAEYGQRALEVIFSAEVLKEIPVLKTALVAMAAIRSIRDVTLLKKLQSFLEDLADLSQDERREMVERLEQDSGYRHRVGVRIIELLDRLDSFRKPKIVAAIFGALARGKIDLPMFHRLNSSVERLPTFEIDNVRPFVKTANDREERARIDPESINALVNCGFAVAHVDAPLGGTVTRYLATRSCEKFVELDLDLQGSDGS